MTVKVKREYRFKTHSGNQPWNLLLNYVLEERHEIKKNQSIINDC